jgi:hypothetical protein
MRPLVLFLAACAAASPVAARYDRCDAIAVHADPDEQDVVKAIVVQRCTNDGWPDCAGLDACRAKLNDEQRDKLAGELDRALDALALGKLVAHKAEMCACRTGDRACAERVAKGWHPDREPRGSRELAAETKKCEKRAIHEDMMAAMERFKDAMCACKVGDKDCAQHVQKDMQDFAEDHRDERDLKLTDDEMKRATDLGMEMMKCSQYAMGVKSP